MIRGRFSILLLSMLVFVLRAQERHTKAQQNGAPNRPKPSDIVLQRLTLEGNPFETFATLVRTVGISGGIVNIDDDCSSESTKVLELAAGTTLSQALNAMAVNTNSDWNMQDNVANVFPRGKMPPLLLAHISRFEWDSTAPIEDVFRQIRNSSEISQRARDFGIEPQRFEHASNTICIRNCDTGGPKPVPMLVLEKDVSLLTLLNHIVGAHKGTVWAYWQHRCNNETTFTFTTAGQ